MDAQQAAATIVERLGELGTPERATAEKAYSKSDLEDGTPRVCLGPRVYEATRQIRSGLGRVRHPRARLVT